MRTLDSATAVWTPSVYTLAVLHILRSLRVDRLFLSFGISEMEVFMPLSTLLGQATGLVEP